MSTLGTSSFQPKKLIADHRSWRDFQIVGFGTSWESKCIRLRYSMRVIGARTLEPKHKGSLFVRCSLSAGNNSRIHLDTQELVLPAGDNSKEYLYWNESFPLVCSSAAGDTVSKLREESLVFELRWRPTTSKPCKFLEKAVGGAHSQLLGSAEVAWRDVVDAPKMEIQTWVALDDVAREASTRGEGVVKACWSLEFAIKVEELEASSESVVTRRRRTRGDDPCGCGSVGDESCRYCADNELLFVTEALEAAF